jgi:periplasmic protein TonB
MFAPDTEGQGPDMAVPPPAEYFRAPLPGTAFSVRLNLGLVERLGREIRNTARPDGGLLGGILLGTINASERCIAIEDYQTVAKGLRQDWLYDSDDERESLRRALTIWRSDPDGRIHAMGMFRTDSQLTPAAGESDAALLARHLPEPASVLLVIGSGSGEKAEAALYLTERGQSRRRGGCLRFPWSRPELSGQSPDSGEEETRTAAGAGKRRLASRAILAGAAAVALLLGAGRLSDRSIPRQEAASGQQVTAGPGAGQASALAAPPALADGSPSAVESPTDQAPDSQPARQSDRAAAAAQGDAESQGPPPPTIAEDAGTPNAGAPEVIVPAAPAPAPVAAVPAQALPVQIPGSPVVSLPAPSEAAGGRIESAVLIRRTEPVYPPMAATTRVSGTVQVAAVVTKDGEVRSAQAVAGPAPLRESAVRAVRGWRYQPALVDGNPVEAEITVEVAFRPGR